MYFNELQPDIKIKLIQSYSSTAACAAAKILCKWEMREVIGNICKTFPYIFIVYYFFLLPLVKS